jgi:hypothetical protein
MTTNINGQQYTSAQEDLSLEKLREGLRQVLTEMVTKQIITKESEADVSPLLDLLALAYALGRLASNPQPKPVTLTERGRLDEKCLELLRGLQTSIRNAKPLDGKLLIDLHEANEKMRQIYYMGREDGAV